MNKDLSPLERNQLLRCVKATGEYRPDIALSYIEEELTGESYDKLQTFLSWVHHNDRKFGWGNLGDVWNEYIQEKLSSDDDTQDTYTIVVTICKVGPEDEYSETIEVEGLANNVVDALFRQIARATEL